jgi:hypothetical protein
MNYLEHVMDDQRARFIEHSERSVGNKRPAGPM